MTAVNWGFRPFKESLKSGVLRVKPKEMMKRLLGAALTLALPALAQASCHYNLRSQTLLQCKAIQQVNGAWTFVDDVRPDEETQVHIYCTCQTALTEPRSGCDASQTRHLTFTVPAQDVREVCSQGPDLCEKPCQKLLKQAPSLED